VRFLVPVGFLALLAVLGVTASSSCVLATRDLPDGGIDADTAAPPPVEEAAPDADTDCGCCTRAITPGLPFCSGKVAFAIPAGDCLQQTCTNGEAYALCEETCYTACACALPEGYSLEPGGFFVEGGAAVGGAPKDGGGCTVGSSAG